MTLQGTGAPEGLLERELELGAIDSILAEIHDGRGGRLLIEGPPGIGKSTLLSAVAARARDASMLCLVAEASEVAQRVAFGVVHDLLARSGEVGVSLAPAAAPDEQSATDTLHEGVRAMLRLSERAPLLLAVDDVQWADPASLRWLALLAARASTASVLVCLAFRGDEHETEGPAVRELLDDRGAVVVRPAPLSVEATAELLRVRLADAADASLAQACHAATDGNPYLLGALIDGLRQAGVPRDADVPARVREIGSRAVRRGLLRRLDALDSEERAFVEAAAVLGDLGGPAALAAVCGLDPAHATDAARRLARLDLLRSPDVTEPSHALIGAAIREQIRAERRERILSEAAEQLISRGEIEPAAALLMELPPRANPAVAERLAEAARLAVRRGAPDVAAPLLRRAVREPPSPESQHEIHAALGRALLAIGDPEAVPAFEQALQDTPSGPAGAELVRLLAQALQYARRTDRAIAVLDAARYALAPDELALSEELEALTLHYLSFDPATRPERLRRLGEPPEQRGASELAYRLRLCEHATESLITCGPAATTVQLCERALAGGVLLSNDPTAHYKVVLLLAYAGRPTVARSHLQEAIARDRARGDTVMLGFEFAVLGEIRRLEGDMVATETDIRTGLELMPPGELGPRFMVRGLIESLVEQDQASRAQDELREHDLTGELPEILPTPGLLLARAKARIALGMGQLGLEDITRAGEIAERLELRDPISVPWRLAAAETMLAIGDRDRATALADEHLRLARQTGAQEAIGAALRMRGLIVGGRAGLDHLRQAVDVLHGGFAKLELARALIDLGSALAAGDPAAGREPLARGAALAEQLGATVLANRAGNELLHAGGRPRRAIRRGAGALTPAERRVARLAAEGMTNREVAETLVVTEKTVESHLSAAFRKLGIRSRTELADQLGPHEAAAEASEPMAEEQVA